MNQKRREQLKGAIKKLEEAKDSIESVRDDEQYSLDNIPENLQTTDRYAAMEAAIDHLDDAVESVDEAIECVSAAIDQ